MPVACRSCCHIIIARFNANNCILLEKCYLEFCTIPLNSKDLPISSTCCKGRQQCRGCRFRWRRRRRQLHQLHQQQRRLTHTRHSININQSHTSFANIITCDCSLLSPTNCRLLEIKDTIGASDGGGFNNKGNGSPTSNSHLSPLSIVCNNRQWSSGHIGARLSFVGDAPSCGKIVSKAFH